MKPVFGQFKDLKTWDGPWVNDDVIVDIALDSFLLNGFEKTVLHLVHNAKKNSDVYLRNRQEW